MAYTWLRGFNIPLWDETLIFNIIGNRALITLVHFRDFLWCRYSYVPLSDPNVTFMTPYLYITAFLLLWHPVLNSLISSLQLWELSTIDISQWLSGSVQWEQHGYWQTDSWRLRDVAIVACRQLLCASLRPRAQRARDSLWGPTTNGPALMLEERPFPRWNFILSR